MIRRATGECEDPVGGNSELSTRIRAIQLCSCQTVRQLLNMAVEREAGDARDGLVGVLDEQAAAIGGPFRVINRAIE